MELGYRVEIGLRQRRLSFGRFLDWPLPYFINFLNTYIITRLNAGMWTPRNIGDIRARAIMRVRRGCWRLRVFSMDCTGFWTQSVKNAFPRKAWERVGNLKYRIATKKIFSTKKGLWIIHSPLNFLVGARGFEPPTPCTPCKCATRLRYTPTCFNA